MKVLRFQLVTGTIMVNGFHLHILQGMMIDPLIITISILVSGMILVLLLKSEVTMFLISFRVHEYLMI